MVDFEDQVRHYSQQARDFLTQQRDALKSGIDESLRNKREYTTLYLEPVAQQVESLRSAVSNLDAILTTDSVGERIDYARAAHAALTQMDFHTVVNKDDTVLHNLNKTTDAYVQKITQKIDTDYLGNANFADVGATVANMRDDYLDKYRILLKDRKERSPALFNSKTTAKMVDKVTGLLSRLSGKKK